MSSTAFGIDLGTSNSVICAYIDGRPQALLLDKVSQSRSPIMPSIIGMQSESDILIGAPAVQLEGDATRFVREAKRHIGTNHRFQFGNRHVSPQEVGAFVLKGLTENIIHRPGIELPVTEAVISVPANFTDAQRQATMDAAKIMGLNVPMLIPEPTAAALAYGIQNLDADEKLVVFDFGGGTLDISLLEMFSGVIDVERVAGDHQLGGKDIDDAIVEWVRQQISRKYPGAQMTIAPNLLKRKCQLAKISLSNSYSQTIFEMNAILYRGQQVPLQIEITREDLTVIMNPILKRATDCIEDLLRGDGSNRRVPLESISRILMVGGSTYIPEVRQRVSEIFGKQVSTDINPDLAVAMGACARSAIYKGIAKDDFMLADISPFSVGVETMVETNTGPRSGYFSVLLEKNAPIPSRSTHTFHLLHPEQDSVDVKVFQGNSQWTAENEFIGSKEINNIPPSLTETPRNLEVDFSFDVSGILELGIRIPDTNINTTLELNPRSGRMSDNDKIQAQNFLNSVNSTSSTDAPLDISSIVIQGDQTPSSSTGSVEDSPLYPQYRAMLKRAKKMAKLHSSKKLDRAITNLEQAIIRQSPNVDDLEDTLTDILLDLDD